MDYLYDRTPDDHGDSCDLNSILRAHGGLAFPPDFGDAATGERVIDNRPILADLDGDAHLPAGFGVSVTTAAKLAALLEA